MILYRDSFMTSQIIPNLYIGLRKTRVFDLVHDVECYLFGDSIREIRSLINDYLWERD